MLEEVILVLYEIFLLITALYFFPQDSEQFPQE